jgi:hypothetical protein
VRASTVVLARAIRRGLANMQIEAYLTAAVINLKRLAAAGHRRDPHRGGSGYGATIWDPGHREHASAGRPSMDPELRARARYMAAPTTRPDAP